MSTNGKEIEEKMTQDTVLASMPQRLRGACRDAYATHELLLRCMDITPEEVIEYIIPFLKANPNIQSVNLSGNWIRARGAEALAFSTSLQALDVSGCGLRDAGAEALAFSTSLKTLNVASNEIGLTGAQALALSTSLQTLNFSFNRIGDAGAEALASNTSLQALNVGGNDIGLTGAEALALNTSLQILNVAGNGMGRTGAEALAINTSLKTLDLSFNCIGDAGALTLASNTSFQTLNVAGNDIGLTGAEALALNTNLQTLDVSANCIGDAGAEALAQNTSLKTLDISNNGIEYAAFCQALLLNDNQTLTECPGISLTPEVEMMLWRNSERATVGECKVIIATLESALIEDLLALILAYRGRSLRYVYGRLQNALSYKPTCESPSQTRDNGEEIKYSAEGVRVFASNMPHIQATPLVPIVPAGGQGIEPLSAFNAALNRSTPHAPVREVNAITFAFGTSLSSSLTSFNRSVSNPEFKTMQESHEVKALREPQDPIVDILVPVEEEYMQWAISESLEAMNVVVFHTAQVSQPRAFASGNSASSSSMVTPSVLHTQAAPAAVQTLEERKADRRA